MIGPGDELLYVGKSVKVRSRLLSYFTADRGDKAAEMIRCASTVDWEYVPNEFCALVREMKQIQRWRPKYNVQHKRKRAYAFVKITGERAPRVMSVTRVAEDGAHYFGPFPQVGNVFFTIRDLSQVMGLRDCAGPTPIFFGDQLEIFHGGRTPRCMRADTGSCLAPCCGACTEPEYRLRVEATRRFLEGRGSEPLVRLETAMEGAVARLDFEYAAQLRDRLERLRSFQEHLTGFRGRVEGLSFVYRVPGFNGDDRVYLIRKGRIAEELPYPKSKKERARVADRVERVYSEAEPGPEALTPEAAAEILLVARWFRLKKKERKRTMRPKKWLEKRGV
jgi:excinuclease ABC subunit C